MNRKKTVIERASLYKKAWEKPLSQLASEYGISDVALKKICKKLNVPTPPRGYWAKLKYGYKVEKIQLPKLKPGDIETHEIIELPDYMKNTPIVRTKDSDLEKEIDCVKGIKVQEVLIDPHRLIKKTEKVINRAKPDGRGLIPYYGEEILDIYVTSEQLNRALRIMDTILKGFESVGYKITGDGAVNIEDVKIPLSISEKYNRTEHVPTEQEKLKIKNDRYFHNVPDWDYFPTGKLQFSYKLDGGRGLQKRWVDSQSRKLEDLIDKIIIGGIKAAKAYQIEQKEHEERQRKWQEEWRRREEESMRRAEEKRHLQVLETQSDNWARAEKLREFIQAVEKSGIKNVLVGKNEVSIQEWAAWARRHADRIDPLVNEDR